MIVPMEMGNVTTFDLSVFWGVALFICIRLFVRIPITRFEGIAYLVAYAAYFAMKYGLI